jgi:hypothetical protein
MPKNRTWIIILTVVLAAAVVYLLTGYVNQSVLQKSLSKEISQSRQDLEIMPVPRSDLAELFDQSNKANQALKNSLSGSSDSLTDVVEKILGEVENTHLQASPISSGEPVEKMLGSDRYYLQPMEMDLIGSLADILIFLEKLENPSEYPSLMITRLEIKNNSPADSQVVDQVTGSLTLAIISAQNNGR